MIGYRPNAAARTLVTGRSRTIGVASFDTALYGPASTLAGIERAAHAEGYFTSIVTLQTLDRKSLTIGLERLQQQGADGILVIAPLTDAVNTLPLLAMRVPLVAVETGPDEGVPVIAIDQRAGGALATQHLLDLGHPTVHHLAGPPEFLEAPPAPSRLARHPAGRPCPRSPRPSAATGALAPVTDAARNSSHRAADRDLLRQ